MDKELLDIVEGILESSDEVILPVKKLWKILHSSDEFSEVYIPPLGEFTTMLRDDSRFQFMHPIDYTEMYSELDEEERRKRQKEMEEAGFFSGDRIKLSRIAITGELLARMIERSSERMMEALTKAWKANPGDAEGEKRLLTIMEKAQQLQKDIQKVVDQIRENDRGGSRES